MQKIFHMKNNRKGVYDEMDGTNANDFRIQSSDHERGHVMEKLVY